jgi:hypothetical protein
MRLVVVVTAEALRSPRLIAARHRARAHALGVALPILK